MSKRVIILMSDRFKTQFMQHADVFEPFKVVIKEPLLATVVDDFGEKNVQALLKQCENAPYSLVAVYDHEKVYYRDPKVKVVSTGTEWTVLDEVLPKNQQAYQGTEGDNKHERKKRTRRTPHRDRSKAPAD